MPNVKIRRKPFIDRLRCKHYKGVKGRKHTDHCNRFVEGVQIYRICVDCGAIRKSEYVRQDRYKNYHWHNVAVFIKDGKFIRLNVYEGRAFPNQKNRRKSYE